MKKPDSRVAVRGRVGAGPSDRSVAVIKDVVPLDSVSRLVGIEIRNDGPFHVAEVSVLDEDLSTLTGVDAGRRDVLVAAGIDVAGTEAERRSPRVDVVPVVVVVSNAEMSAVLAAVAGRVADEGALPLYTL